MSEALRLIAQGLKGRLKDFGMQEKYRRYIDERVGR